MTDVFVWNSFSCNNSSDYRLIAEFASPEKADEIAKELDAFFSKHAKQYDKVAEGDDFDWPGEPTKAAYELGEKYGFKWSEFLIWGDEMLTGDEPHVASLGKQVVLYHTYSSGGFGPDVPKVLQKAGGTLLEKGAASGAPILLGTFTLPPGPKGEKLTATLSGFFEQTGYPSDFSALEGLEIKNRGQAEEYSFAYDDKSASFTYPIDPDNMRDLQKWIEKRGGKDLVLRLATKKDVTENRQRATKLEAERDKAVAAEEEKRAAAAPKKVAFDPTGLSFLFTGKLASMTRAQAQNHAKAIGGKVASSASKDLGVLVIGDEGSPLYGQGAKGDKQRKVEALNAAGASIHIISEANFFALEGGAPAITAPGVPLFGVAPVSAPGPAAATTTKVSVVVAPGKGYLDALCGARVIDNYLVFAGGMSGDRIVRSATGAKFSNVKTTGRGLRSILNVGKITWKCGEYGTLARSADGLDAFKPIDTKTGNCLFGLAAAPDGAIWLSGDQGFVMRSKDGKEFTKVNGVRGRVSAGQLTSLGLLLPLASGLYRVDGKKATLMGLSKNVQALVETPSGALVVVGAKNSIYRSVDKGVKFRAAKVPPFEGESVKNPVERASWISPSPDLNVIAMLPDGRIVVGGDEGVILVSTDDGATFTRVTHGTTDATFWAGIEFRGAVYLGGENGAIVRVD